MVTFSSTMIIPEIIVNECHLRKNESGCLELDSPNYFLAELLALGIVYQSQHGHTSLPKEIVMGLELSALLYNLDSDILAYINSGISIRQLELYRRKSQENPNSLDEYTNLLVKKIGLRPFLRLLLSPYPTDQEYEKMQALYESDFKSFCHFLEDFGAQGRFTQYISDKDFLKKIGTVGISLSKEDFNPFVFKLLTLGIYCYIQENVQEYISFKKQTLREGPCPDSVRRVLQEDLGKEEWFRMYQMYCEGKNLDMIFSAMNSNYSDEELNKEIVTLIRRHPNQEFRQWIQDRYSEFREFAGGHCQDFRFTPFDVEKIITRFERYYESVSRQVLPGIFKEYFLPKMIREFLPYLENRNQMSGFCKILWESKCLNHESNGCSMWPDDTKGFHEFVKAMANCFEIDDRLVETSASSGKATVINSAKYLRQKYTCLAEIEPKKV